MKIEEFARRLGDVQRRQAHFERLLTRVTLTVEGAARREAPVRTGHLRRTITHRVELTNARGIVGTNASYARAVHDGSRRHVILPKFISRSLAQSEGGGSHVLVFRIGSKRVFTRLVRHPGTKPNPFFERALAVSRDSIDRLMTEAGAAYLAELAR